MAISKSRIKDIATRILEDTDLLEDQVAEAAERIADKILAVDPDSFDDEDGSHWLESADEDPEDDDDLDEQ